MRISLIHAVTPGRLRFEVPGLYRSPVRQNQVEQRLGALELFEDIQVNTLTGRVRVLFDPTTPCEDVIARLEQALDEWLPPEVPSAAPRARRKRPRSTPGHHKDTGDDIAWHARASAEILQLLSVDPVSGLNVAEVEQRLQHYGLNQLDEATRRSILTIILKQFNSLPVAMLGVSAGIAVATGGIADAGVILGVVLINATIGYFTEEKAEETIAALGKVTPTDAEVLRQGRVSTVPVAELVPGDVLLLAPGSQVAADARLLQARRLTIDESALTGESVPVTKRASEAIAADASLGDRRNMAYMGTLVTGGNGVGVIVATGAATELGRIQTMVETTESPETPLQRQLDQMGTQLGILSGLVCVGVFAVGVMRGQGMLQMLNSAVSLAVAAVPEGLPAVATTTLALGIREMQAKKVAVRHIDAVETLGSLQVLCLDKTGTLTTNRMQVVAAHFANQHLAIDDNDLAPWLAGETIEADDNLYRLLQVVVLCNEVETNGGEFEGSSTEIALIELAQANGIDVQALRTACPRAELRERAEGRPLMSSIHALEGHWLIAVKGSPKELLERCSHHILDGQRVPLEEVMRERLLAANEQMAAKALRNLAVAYRETETEGDYDAEGLTWLGLLGLKDPLRPGMVELMDHFHEAGIKTVMITGDQSATAAAIGRELHLNRDHSLEILDSSSLGSMNPELLAGLVSRIDVFARVSPANKLEIVQALQRAGKVVAMTGDGINDGPALKAADIGIALGAGGTDVARSVADMVIEDDNLHTLVKAVEQGRAIYSDIRKTIHYLLSTNFSEIEVMLTAIASGLGQPLNPMQLLWINLATDIFPGLALSLEPASADIMQQPPRPAGESIISRKKLRQMAGESAFITTGALAAFLLGRLSGGQQHGSTLAFHTLTLAQLVHANVCRSEHHGLFNPVDRPRNHWLEGALGGTALVHLLIMSLPSMRRLFGTTPLGLADLAIIATGATVPMLANEAVKAAREHANRQQDSQPHDEGVERP